MLLVCAEMASKQHSVVLSCSHVVAVIDGAVVFGSVASAVVADAVARARRFGFRFPDAVVAAASLNSKPIDERETSLGDAANANLKLQRHKGTTRTRGLKFTPTYRTCQEPEESLRSCYGGLAYEA